MKRSRALAGLAATALAAVLAWAAWRATNQTHPAPAEALPRQHATAPGRAVATDGVAPTRAHPSDMPVPANSTSARDVAADAAAVRDPPAGPARVAQSPPVPPLVAGSPPRPASPPTTPTDPLADPALLAAAREIEDAMLSDRRLDASRATGALHGDAFAATFDAFVLQSHHDASAARLVDLLCADMAVRLGALNGRLDRLECGRSLCAAQYTFLGDAPRQFDHGGPSVAIGELTPAGHVYRAIFATDPRIWSVAPPRVRDRP